MKDFNKKHKVTFFLSLPISLPLFLFMTASILVMSLFMIIPYIRVPFYWAIWMFDGFMDKLKLANNIWKES